MPIYNISGIAGTHSGDPADQTSVLVGTIRKGEKEEKQARNGGTYERPKNLDYFRVNFREDMPELAEEFYAQTGQKPRMIRCRLAYPSIDKTWFAWNTVYKGVSMFGMNDGYWWNYLRDAQTQAPLVTDYMLTKAGREGVQSDRLAGYNVIPAAWALQRYLDEFQRPELPLPLPWQRVKMEVERYSEGGRDEPLSLLNDPNVPAYKTQKDEYFATPEGRLHVTMPHLPSFNSFMMLQFRTGSRHDIIKISQNLIAILQKAATFDSPEGCIPIDQIPLILVRRHEMIAKPLDDKLVRTAEWLVHLQTEPRWQKKVDDLALLKSVYHAYGVIQRQQHLIQGLAATVSVEGASETPLLPALGSVDELEPIVLDGIKQWPATITDETGSIVEPSYEDDQGEPEPEIVDVPKKAAASKKAAAPSKKPVAGNARDDYHQAAVALLDGLDDGSKLTPTEFWKHYLGMGYTNAQGIELLGGEIDYVATLRAAVERYETA